MPLLEGLDGVNKMSKSLDNYISIVDSPKEMFGKSMRVSDDLMYRYYELLTEITPKELNQLQEDVKSGKKHPRDVKVNLAKYFVTRYHSSEAAQRAEDEFNRIFVDKGLPDEVPELKVSAEKGLGLSALMVKAGLVTSNGEGSRLIQGGGVSLNGEKVADAKLKLDLEAGREYLIKAGKKKFIKVIVESKS